MPCRPNLIFSPFAKVRRGELNTQREILSRKDKKNKKTSEENGAVISYLPDDSMFKKFRYRNEFVERMLRYYTYLNKGLTIRYNGKSALDQRMV